MLFGQLELKIMPVLIEKSGTDLEFILKLLVSVSVSSQAASS